MDIVHEQTEIHRRSMFNIMSTLSVTVTQKKKLISFENILKLQYNRKPLSKWLKG